MYSDLLDQYKHFTDHYVQKTIDELDPKQQAPNRVYKDASTSAFNNIFFKTDIQRYRFVDFVFHKIHADLMLQMNDSLRDRGYDPLGGSEQAKFYYKGGNVFHEYFCDEMYPHIPNPQFKESISKNFKTSDNDFSIHIVADNYRRYLQIYQVTVGLLAKSMTELSTLFDLLLNEPTSSPKTEPIIDHDLDLSVKQYRSLQENLSHVRYLYQSDNYDQKEIDKLKAYMREIQSWVSVDLIVLVTKYQFLEMWGIYSRETVDLNTIRVEIKNLVKNKANVFVFHGFYDSDKITAMKTEIIRELQTLEGKSFYDADGAEYIYSPNDQTTVNLEASDNMVIYPKNDPWDPIRVVKQGKSHHPITFNDTIHTLNDRGLNDIHFALMRIKLAIKLKNGITVNGKPKDLAIPSELIDVSITKYNPATDYTIDYIKLVQFGNYMSLYTYDIDGMTYDIMKPIFGQRIFVILDLKYQKRLIRLMTFLYLSCKTRNDMRPYDAVIKISDAIHQNLTTQVPFDPNLLQPLLAIPCDVLPGLITDDLNLSLLTVKPEYEIIQPIITYIVISMAWLGQPLEKWRALMDKYRPLYSFVPITNTKDYYAVTKSALVDLTRTLVQVGQSIKKDVMLGGADGIKYINQIRFIECAKDKPVIHQIKWTIGDILNVS